MTENKKFLKMYILIRDDIPEGIAFVATAHASLALYLKYKDNQDMKDWLENSFKKVVCKISSSEFKLSKHIDKCLIITESSLDNKEVALVFVPREEWPAKFKFFTLAGKNK